MEDRDMTTDETVAEGFYVLSLKYSKTSETLVWWRPKAAGYLRLSGGHLHR
jgi:hypothetical protein